MTQLKTQRSPGELATKTLDVVLSTIGKLFAAGERAVDRAFDRLRGDHGLRTIPSHEATPMKLATHPHTTIRLSEEQTAVAIAIERDDESVDRPATPA